MYNAVLRKCPISCQVFDDTITNLKDFYCLINLKCFKLSKKTSFFAIVLIVVVIIDEVVVTCTNFIRNSFTVTTCSVMRLSFSLSF